VLGGVDFWGVVGGLTGILHELLEVRCIEDTGEGVLATLSLLAVRRIWIGFLEKPTLGGDADKFAASSCIRDFISMLEFRSSALCNVKHYPNLPRSQMRLPNASFTGRSGRRTRGRT
jgi:hypothetical protein